MEINSRTAVSGWSFCGLKDVIGEWTWSQYFRPFPEFFCYQLLGAQAEKKKVFRRYSSLPRYAFSKLCKLFFPPRGTVFPNICPDNKTIRKSNTDFMRPERSRLISNRKKAKGTKHPPPVSTLIRVFIPQDFGNILCACSRDTNLKRMKPGLPVLVYNHSYSG